MKYRTTLLMGLCLASSPVHAWNDKGHMTVAAVAWSEMSTEAKLKAAALLKKNPHYGKWTRGVPDAEKGRVAFLRAATWPDKIRSEYEDDGYNAKTAKARQNVAYDGVVHRYWHFKDYPFSVDGSPLPEIEEVNAVSRIELFRDTIKSSTADDNLKSFNLSWLIHLVGDIHQPLHATARYSAWNRDRDNDGQLDGDGGGNSVKICESYVNVCGTDASLHSFWDGAIGNSKNTDVAIKYAEQELRRPDETLVAISDPNTWALESFELAKNKVYTGPVGTKKQKVTKLNKTYEAQAGITAKQRISLAGHRLAKMLNAVLQ